MSREMWYEGITVVQPSHDSDLKGLVGPQCPWWYQHRGRVFSAGRMKWEDMRGGQWRFDRGSLEKCRDRLSKDLNDDWEVS